MAPSTRSHDAEHFTQDHNETTALLAAANGDVARSTDPDTANPTQTNLAVANNDNINDDDDVEDDIPLPKGQIILLCFARLFEPIAFFGILPFVNQMVQRNGSLAESEVGFYSGLIESLFSLTQMVVMLFWGRASDRFGRKPVLVVSMVGVTVMTSLFGLCRTIGQMIACRCLAGVFAGTVVTIRTMITELSTPRTQARAFSFFMFASNLGIFLGPLVGGVLADPAGQYGGVFKRSVFFERYPYALATFATGLIGLAATVTTALFVKETLPSKVSTDAETTNGKPKDLPLSMWQLVKQPGVAVVLYLYSHVMLLAYAYTAVMPVFWFTSIRLGGFAFTPIQISLMMALTGASQAIWILLAFTPLQHRYGTGGVLRACSLAYLLFFACNPVLNGLLRHAELHDQQWEKTLFWVLGPILLCVGVGVSMSFTAIQLALNDISPSHATLGTLNGLALSLASGVRAFSPALFTSIFAVGVQRQILGGYLVWVVLLVLAAGFVVLARNLPAKAEGRLKPKGTRTGVTPSRT